MSSSPTILLALAPGRRESGVAIFADTKLIYCAVKTLRSRQSNKLLPVEIGRILQKQINDFAPRIVVVKAISRYQKLSPKLAVIMRYIKLAARKNNLEITEISLEQIKAMMGGKHASTEKAAFRKLIAAYPELARYWNRPNKWQNDYYAFLFSAVAAGAVYLKTHSEERLSS